MKIAAAAIARRATSATAPRRRNCTLPRPPPTPTVAAGFPGELVGLGDQQAGACCYPVSGSCQGDWDCCDGRCDNGTCACLAVNNFCYGDGCCSGSCVQMGLGAVCLGAAGDPCDGPEACISQNCDEGSCGSCSAASGGPCSTTADCCSGATCAALLAKPGSIFPPAMDAGLCCGPAGADCDGGDGDCCSQRCSDGVCICQMSGDPCFNSEGCCAGGACLQLPGVEFIDLACCQMDGQSCSSDYDCCSLSCQDHATTAAALAQGGSCEEAQ